MSENIFKNIHNEPGLFRNKELLRHTHIPNRLPHRNGEIDALRRNLVEALSGNIPSNMILYGVTGAGKTAVTRFVLGQLEEKAREIGSDVSTTDINCRNIDTQYRVLAHLGNSIIDDFEEKIPFTGWPTDKVYSELMKRMDSNGGVHVIVLDEVDHLVKKSGDDLLYNLTSMNTMFRNARMCVIGISNDLTFTEHLDPRVRSRLGQEDVFFAPYDANQLQEILRNRLDALRESCVNDGVIELCAAMGAREHGDARRALDLLRASAEEAERENGDIIETRHVRIAHNRLERDQMTPTISTLPLHQKLVLFSVLVHDRRGVRRISTGEVYQVYKQACRNANSIPLTARRITDLISNLDMLGLISANTISRGRYGRSKEITSCIPSTLDAATIMVKSDDTMSPVIKATYSVQGSLR